MKNAFCLTFLVFFVLGCYPKSKSEAPIRVRKSEKMTEIYNIPSPYGVTARGGRIYVSDLNPGRILIFDQNGQLLRSVLGDFKKPHSVLVINDNELIVSDYSGQVFHVLLESSIQMSPFFPHVQFKGPVHVLKLQNGKWIVTDFELNKLFVFNSDLTLDPISTSKISNGFPFNKPHMTQEDSDKNLYVADSGGGLIVKFDSAFNFRGQMAVDDDSWVLNPGKKTGNQQVVPSTPTSILVQGPNLIIAEISYNRLRKIKLSTGETVGIMGATKDLDCSYTWLDPERVEFTAESKCFNNPYDFSIDQNTLYVADTKNQRILILPAN